MMLLAAAATCTCCAAPWSCIGRAPETTAAAIAGASRVTGYSQPRLTRLGGSDAAAPLSAATAGAASLPPAAGDKASGVEAAAGACDAGDVALAIAADLACDPRASKPCGLGRFFDKPQNVEMTAQPPTATACIYRCANVTKLTAQPLLDELTSCPTPALARPRLATPTAAPRLVRPSKGVKPMVPRQGPLTATEMPPVVPDCGAKGRCPMPLTCWNSPIRLSRGHLSTSESPLLRRSPCRQVMPASVVSSASLPEEPMPLAGLHFNCRAEQPQPRWKAHACPSLKPVGYRWSYLAFRIGL
jgi:hypothetical protein